MDGIQEGTTRGPPGAQSTGMMSDRHPAE